MPLAANGPDWLGSPQHVIAGIALATAVVAAARLCGLRTWLAVVLALGATCTAELLVELIEYPLLYAGAFHRSAYWDTVSDMASTLAGGIAGAVATAWWARAWRPRLRVSAEV
jgi:hypothetical protein